MLTRSYEWVAYAKDGGLVTIREVTARDLAKAAGQSEALEIIDRLKRADRRATEEE